MPVTREEVIAGFRLILGREPGDEAAIAAHMPLRDPTELAAVLPRSPEFVRGPRFKDFLAVRERDNAAQGVRFAHESRAGLRVLLIGNCQVATIGQLMQAMTGDTVATAIESTPSWLDRVTAGEIDLEPLLAESDLVYVQLIGSVVSLVEARYPAYRHKLRHFMPINYTAFHPDCVYVKTRDGRHLQGPMGDYHSSIAFWAWREGWSESEALALFRPEVYELLGFDGYDESSRKVLLEYGGLAGLPMAPLLDRWLRVGVFMHTINHPKVGALADLAAELLRREGIAPMEDLGALVEDSLAQFPVWPVYPPVAVRYGVPGSYLFKVDRGSCPPSQPQIALSLEQFVRGSFERYREEGAGLDCERVNGADYAKLAELKPSVLARFFRRNKQAMPAESGAPSEDAVQRAPGGNPYSDLPDHHFWRRMMEQTPPSKVDPVGAAAWRISTTDKVATAGSCFAQHISRTLRRQGFSYFMTETGKGLSVKERNERQFGVYSARYGNLYTARQLIQLFDRAYGHFSPLDTAWQRPDGRFVDPFRPQVEPAGFATETEVSEAATKHLAAVRELFEQMDVFVFTLGLTEAWQRREDGAVFPLAPGVVAGDFDAGRYQFLNFGVAEVLQDIRGALRRLRSVNPRVRFIFTVSPVPLIATYEDRHVLVSTTESKAILRAAIGEAAASDAGITYFPSYEIVTGAHSRGKYFAADLRTVTDRGIGHVMHLFLKHYAQQPDAPQAPPASATRAPAHALLHDRMEEQRRVADIVCDEEAITRHRTATR
jgi:hypothetical protein